MSENFFDDEQDALKGIALLSQRRIAEMNNIILEWWNTHGTPIDRNTLLPCGWSVGAFCLAQIKRTHQKRVRRVQKRRRVQIQEELRKLTQDAPSNVSPETEE